MDYNSILAKFKTDFRKYNETNQIDDETVYEYYIDALEGLGALVTEETSGIVHIENYQGILPSNFYSLRGATKYEPHLMKVGCKEDEIGVLNSMVWHESVLERTYWNLCSGDCIDYTVETTDICEKTFIGTIPVEKYYNNPTELNLTKKLIKGRVSHNHLFKHTNNNVNEVNIQGKTLFTNFKKGIVYVYYDGYLQDEDGLVSFEDKGNGTVKRYLLASLKRRFIEDLITNGEAEGLASMYKVYYEQEQISYTQARGAIKFEELTPASFKKLRDSNRQERRKFEFLR